jgi:hypothetical protein
MVGSSPGRAPTPSEVKRAGTTSQLRSGLRRAFPDPAPSETRSHIMAAKKKAKKKAAKKKK